MIPPDGFENSEMPAKVVDASVLGALIFKEPRVGEAADLLEGAELISSPLRSDKW